MPARLGRRRWRQVTRRLRPCRPCGAGPLAPPGPLPRRLAQGHRPGVGVEALDLGEAHDRRRHRLQARGGELEDAGAPEEVVDPQRRGEARGPGGGEDVAGAGDVVTHRLGGVGPEEHGAGGLHLGQGLPGPADHELEVLGGEGVGDLEGGVEVRDEDRRPLLQGRLGDGPAREGGQLLAERRLHRVEQRRVGGHQDRDRPGVVLGLGQEVGGDEVGPGRVVGDHQDLAGPRLHVHVAGPADQALGGGDVGVAGADDLVDPGHGLGAVGERRHRLGPADAEHPVDPGDLGGGEEGRVGLAPRRGRDHDDLRAPRRPAPAPRS